MSKEQLLAEIAKLAPEDREDLLEELWSLKGQAILNANGPTEEERALLDRELED